jgi:hypothetical protein
MRTNIVRALLVGCMLCLSSMAETRALPATGHPDFSGVWQLDKSKSRVDPSSEAIWMRVEQSGATILINLRVFQRGGKEEDQTFVYTIGNPENSNLMHGAPMKSRVEWEGEALAVHSAAMFGNDVLNIAEQLTLSADGSILMLNELTQFASEPENKSLFFMNRRAEKDWPPETVNRPAEQVFRNIQVLKGMPASKLPATMGGFTRALGVSCSQCHVSGRPEIDEMKDKKIARKMIQLVATINSENALGTDAVTCWTCHRGTLKAETSPK